MATVILDDRFLGSAYSLPKEIGRKIFKALHLFSKNPDHPGLHRERLSGRADGLFSIRVDNDYRIIFRELGTTPVLIEVAKHDTAYRSADRIATHDTACRSADWIATHDTAYRSADRIATLPTACQSDADIFSAAAPDEIDTGIHFLRMRERRGVQLRSEVDVNDVARLVGTRKYLPLAQFLSACRDRSVSLSFGEVAKIIAEQLPPAAMKHRAWWANHSGRHVQAAAWLGVGWLVENVDLENKKVVLLRR